MLNVKMNSTFLFFNTSPIDPFWPVWDISPQSNASLNPVKCFSLCFTPGETYLSGSFNTFLRQVVLFLFVCLLVCLLMFFGPANLPSPSWDPVQMRIHRREFLPLKETFQLNSTTSLYYHV